MTMFSQSFQLQEDLVTTTNEEKPQQRAKEDAKQGKQRILD